jgi:hypothetical protein
VDIFWLVYNWLCDERNGRWLMILDNADDDQVFSTLDADLRATTQAAESAGEAIPLASFLP